MHSAVQESTSPGGQQAARRTDRERGEEKEERKEKERKGEGHLRHLRLSPFHLQPDSYFLKLSTR